MTVWTRLPISHFTDKTAENISTKLGRYIQALLRLGDPDVSIHLQGQTSKSRYGTSVGKHLYRVPPT